MPANDPEYQRQYKAKHYAENKQRYIDQASERRRKLREEVNKIKDVSCMDCGVKYSPWVMHFDHREGNERKGEACISRLVCEYRKKKVFEEIAKCDIVCANCHAERTHQRQAALMSAA